MEERHFIIQLITGCSETLRKRAASVPGALKTQIGSDFNVIQQNVYKQWLSNRVKKLVECV